MIDIKQVENLPRYQCHKRVWALKIKMVTRRFVEGTTTVLEAIITPEDSGYDGFTVSGDYVRKHDPKPGGYWVMYLDGYQSFSPAEAFEEGYTRI